MGVKFMHWESSSCNGISGPTILLSLRIGLDSEGVRLTQREKLRHVMSVPSKGRNLSDKEFIENLRPQQFTGEGSWPLINHLDFARQPCVVACGLMRRLSHRFLGKSCILLFEPQPPKRHQRACPWLRTPWSRIVGYTA